MLCQRYYLPTTVSEALAILVEAQGSARVLAGGTDLVLQLKRGERRVETLVDIGRISDLRHITVTDGVLRIGSLVTFSELMASKALRSSYPALVEAASEVGSPQIRNIATLVGNLINAEPAADGAIALRPLDGIVKVVSPDGEKTITLDDLFIAPGESSIDSTREVVTEVILKLLPPVASSAFGRLAKRKALALPILNTAVTLSVDEEKRVFRDVRVALGPVAPVPFRARRAEQYLKGGPITVDAVERAAQIASEESDPRDSPLRGSREYRKQMIKVLVGATLWRALNRISVYRT